MKRALTLVLLISTLVIVGCATTPKTRFPEYYKVESRSPNIDVIVDTVVLSDISGSDIGFNKEKNMIAQSLVNDSVPSVFSVRGYSPNILYIGNGTFLDLDEDRNYFISEDFKNTGTPYSRIEKTERKPVWANEDVREFIKRLTEYAPLANKKKSSSRSRKESKVKRK